MSFIDPKEETMSHQHSKRGASVIALALVMLSAMIAAAAFATAADARGKNPPSLTSGKIPVAKIVSSTKPSAAKLRAARVRHSDQIVLTGGYGGCGLAGYQENDSMYQASNGTWIGVVDTFGEAPDCSYYNRYDYYYWTGSYWQLFGHYALVNGTWYWRTA